MLDALDNAERDEVVAAATSLQLKTHDVLAQQGAPAASFYLVEAGRLRLSQLSESGRETAARTVGPGQSFGGTMLTGRPRYLLSARAQQPTRVLAWTRPLLMALIDKYPQLRTRIIETESKPSVVARARFEDPAESTVLERLSYLLTRLAANGSRHPDGSLDIVHSLTRQDLADLISSELVEVSGILKSWEDAGVVQTSRSHIRVIDPSRLSAIARA